MGRGRFHQYCKMANFVNFDTLEGYINCHFGPVWGTNINFHLITTYFYVSNFNSKPKDQNSKLDFYNHLEQCAVVVWTNNSLRYYISKL